MAFNISAVSCWIHLRSVTSWVNSSIDLFDPNDVITIAPQNPPLNWNVDFNSLPPQTDADGPGRLSSLLKRHQRQKSAF